MDSTTLLSSIGSLLYGLGQLIVLVACIILIIKKKGLAPILILVSILLQLILSIGGIFWLSMAGSKGGAEDILRINVILSILKGISYILFAVGLVLLAFRLKK